MYNAIAGSCAEEEANAGGGGSSATGNELIQMATSATGAYPNQVVAAAGQALGFWFNNPLQHASNPMHASNSFDGNADLNYEVMEELIEMYSEVIESDFGSTLGYSTETGPERDVVHVAFSIQAFCANVNTNGYLVGSKPRLLIGGYIRGWDSGTPLPQGTPNNSGLTSPLWTVDSAALISSSISNGCSVGLVDAVNTRTTFQDNLPPTNATGIYVNSGTTTSSFKLLEVTLAATGKSIVCPAQGDTFTLRVKADGTMAGAAQTQRLFDIKVTWV